MALSSGTKTIIGIVVFIAIISGVVFAISASNDESQQESGSGSDATSTKYTISVNKEGNGNVTGSGIYAAGNTVILIATPDSGYNFTGWYDGNKVVSYYQNYQFKASSSITLTAKFTNSQHTITVSSDNKTAGTVSGGGTVNYGAQLTLKATTNYGYEFTGWYDGSLLLSTSATYAHTTIKSADVIGKFSPIHDADFSYSLSTTTAPSIITVYSKYNVEIAYRTWTFTDTLNGQTIKYQDFLNSLGSSTLVTIQKGMGIDVTQMVEYKDGKRASYTKNIVVNQTMTNSFSWKYHEDYRGAWWNPFDKDDLDPNSMNRDASMTISMNFSWYYQYASDPVIRNSSTGPSKFITTNDAVIKSLVESLKSKTSGWSDIDRVNFVLHFVQSIPYKYDTEGDATSEHWNYPAETLWRNQGDCEDHALLFATLMKAMGYSTAVFDVACYDSSGKLTGYHLAVGLAVNGGSGTAFNLGGKNYFYCESTPGLSGSNWRNLGYMPAGYKVTSYWLV